MKRPLLSLRNKNLDRSQLIKNWQWGKVLLVFLVLFVFLQSSSAVFAQIPVSRPGFPFCETFIGSSFSRPEIKIGGAQGSTFLPYLSGESLVLTNNEQYKSGYAYIDIPYSNAYGIQVSFEYLSYNRGSFPGDVDFIDGLGADGISFFMFDGNIEESDFKIGGFGGSLGYAPIANTPGLSGGYIGIGFDEWGNFANRNEGRNTPPMINTLVPHNVTIRGPQVAPPNFVFTGDPPVLGLQPNPDNFRHLFTREVNTGPNPFTIDANPGRTVGVPIPDNCSNLDDDFRKVFINLRPKPSGPGYFVDVLMRVGTDPTPITIISDLDYNFPGVLDASSTIKMGFAASTGANSNFHEIRNLAVDVSETADIPEPTVEPKFYRTCIDEDVDIIIEDFEIRSAQGFIQCINLYDETLDVGAGGQPWNTSRSSTDHLEFCGLTPICNVCSSNNDPVNYADFGEFEIELQNPDGQGGDLGLDVINFTFVQATDATPGTRYVYYTVTDNFGITSEPQKIEITINPIPEIDPDSLEIDNPTCDGQDDGNIIVEVNKLVDDFDQFFVFEWKFFPLGTGLFEKDGNDEFVIPDEFIINEPGSPLPTSATKSETQVEAGVWSFELDGINLGEYVLIVGNPKNTVGDFCFEVLRVSLVDKVKGIPINVFGDPICENEDPAILNTSIPNELIDGLSPVYLWYSSNDRNDLIASSENDDPFPPDVNGVTYLAKSDGTLEITGLTSAGLNSATYEFFVELKFDDSNEKNICSPENLVFSGEVTVYPKVIDIGGVTKNDFCLEGEGIINISATRGNEDITDFTLLDSDQNPIPGRTNQTSGLFEGLPKGTYFVSMASTGLTGALCDAISGPFIIQGPEEELSITVNSDDPTCELDNGSITWEVSGGNGGYEMVSIDGYPNGITPTVTQSGQFGEFYTIENLISTDSPYTLTLTVKDSEECEIFLSQLIEPQVLPVYELEDQVICIDGDRSITPVENPSGTPNPETVFRWYSNLEATSEIVTGQNTDIGANFDINSSTGQLTVSGFVADGTYTFYMKPEVLNGCDMPVVPVTITVNPLPAPVFEEIEPTCFGLSDGKLRLVSGGQDEYSYELVGSSVTFDGTDFDGIPAGDYIIRVTNTVTQCTIDFPGLMEQPDLMTIQQVGLQDPTCGLDNGEVAYSFAGGTGDYEVFLNGQLVTTHTEAEINTTQLLSDLAEGSYTLRIEDANDCFAEFSFVMSPLDFPAFAVTDAVICELDPTSANRDFLTATVSPVVVNLSNADPSYSWYYLDGAGNEIQIQNGSTVFGANASIDGASNLSLQGLVANADPYIVYLRVTGEFVCDNSLIPSEILVNPLPSPVFVVEDATCFGESDGRLVLDSDGSDDYTYELLSSGIAFDGTSFDGLPAGNYTIRVTNIVTDCFDDFVLTVGQPDQLQLLEVELVDPTCEIDNGILRYRFLGGTGDYTVFLDEDEVGVFETSQLDQVLEISDLAGGTYTLSIIDSNGCEDEFDFTLDPRELPEFAVTDAVICELDPMSPDRDFLTATVSLVTVTLSNAIPVYNWYYLDGAGNEVEIQDGDLVFGANASINAAGELSLQGLEANAEPYMVYLRVTGDNVCDDSLIPSEILVNPLPAPVFTVEDVTCFEGSNGSLILESGGSDDYTYEILSSTVAFDGTAFVGLPAGVYTIRATNSITECFDEFEYEINQPEELLLLEIDGDDPTCGQPNGEISFRVTGGTPDYIIKINGDDLESFEHTISGTGRIFVRGLEPGTYTVSVIDGNECEVEQVDWITLTNNDGEEVSAIPDEVIICEGGIAVLDPEITVGGGLTPTLTWYFDANLMEPIAAGTDAEGVEYSFSADGSLQVSGLVEGNYEYFVRIGGEGICVTSTFGTVEVLAPLLADVEVEDIICFGEENGIIRVTDLSGGTGDYEFSLNGTDWQEENEFTDLAPGTYTVSIRDKSQLEGCILEIPDVEIASPPGPIELLGFERFAESCEDANGEIFNIQISGGWGAYQHEWRKDDPASGPILTGSLTEIRDLEAGIYYLIVTDEKGCEAIFDFEILVAPDPQYIVLPPVDECEGNDVLLAPLHVAVNPNTPSARTNVSWYKGANQTGLIEEGADPNDADVFYTIDDSDYLNPKLTISGLAPGTYTYYFFVECTGDEMPISVSIAPTPDVVFETSDETCFGENNGRISILSGHQTGHQYTIGNTVYTAEELESQNFEGGVYDIEVLSTNGCFQIAQVEIEAATELTLDLLGFKNAACGVDDGFIEVRVGGGRAPYELLLTETNSGDTRTLTGNGSEFKFDNLSQGNYTVQVTDDSFCDTVLANPVEVEDGPSEILLDDEYFICEDEDIELRPGVNPANANARYNWYLNSVSPGNEISDGQTINGATVSINNDGSRFGVAGLTLSDSPVNLFVTVEGPGICEGDVVETRIVVLGTPEVTASKQDEVCFGDLGKIFLSPAAGSGPLEYSVNGGDFQAYANNVIEDLTPGDYQITARNQGECTLDLPMIRIEGPIEALRIEGFGNVGASCEEDNGIIFGEVYGGDLPYLLQIRSGGQQINRPIDWDNERFTVSELALGTYEITIIDSRGCDIVAGTTEVTDEPTPIAVDNVTICEGEVAELRPYIPGVPSSPGYRWYMDASKTTAIPVGTSQADGKSFELSNNGVLRISGLRADEAPYNYFVELALSASCELELAEAIVDVNPLPQLRTFNPSLVCDPNETVNLTNFIDNFNPNVYDYEVVSPSGSIMRLDELATVSSSGTYVVRASFKNSSCFTNQERIIVRIANEELSSFFNYELDLGAGTIAVNEDIGIDEEVSFKDDTSGEPIAWEWDFGDGNTSTEQNPTHVYTEKGAYTITLTTYSAIGCVSVYQRVIDVFDDYLIIFPNAFTPKREDGKNVLFYPKYRGLAELKVYIFNTWGDLIYVSENFEQGGWDGMLNGEEVPNGNYVYKAEYLTRGGDAKTVAGVFILIK